MRVVIRVDSSTQMGSGHIMRCRTLAHALRDRGHEVRFVCRQHPGALTPLIRSDGFEIFLLAPPDSTGERNDPAPYAQWLGVPPIEDAMETIRVLDGWRPDWLLVDHYALSHPWEALLRQHVHRILVIDDLADRPHDCDILVDQNLAEARVTAYEKLIGATAQRLIGPQYALVRPEFLRQRTYSLGRRRTAQANRLLVFMGGSDPDNDTQKVLVGIARSHRSWQHVDFVVGSGYPELATLQQAVHSMPQSSLHVQTNRMAELMAAADLAVTAGGSVSWEKCVLGLPSIVAVSGDNQAPIATALHAAGAQRTLGVTHELEPTDYACALDNLDVRQLEHMSAQASQICDGRGTQRIISTLESY